MVDTGFNDLGRFASARRWTKEAIECYQRGCICKNCPHKNGFGAAGYTFKRKNPCQMKACVLELVRKFGRPEISEQAI